MAQVTDISRVTVSINVKQHNFPLFLPLALIKSVPRVSPMDIDTYRSLKQNYKKITSTHSYFKDRHRPSETALWLNHNLQVAARLRTLLR